MYCSPVMGKPPNNLDPTYIKCTALLGHVVFSIYLSAGPCYFVIQSNILTCHLQAIEFTFEHKSTPCPLCTNQLATPALLGGIAPKRAIVRPGGQCVQIPVCVCVLD